MLQSDDCTFIKQLYYVKRQKRLSNRNLDDLEKIQKDLGMNVARLNVVAIKISETQILG